MEIWFIFLVVLYIIDLVDGFIGNVCEFRCWDNRVSREKVGFFLWFFRVRGREEVLVCDLL